MTPKQRVKALHWWIAQRAIDEEPPFTVPVFTIPEVASWLPRELAWARQRYDLVSYALDDMGAVRLGSHCVNGSHVRLWCFSYREREARAMSKAGREACFAGRPDPLN